MIPTKTIQLDFWRHPTDILHLVQGEADGRKVTFKITDNGAAFNLTGYTVQMAVKKPDGNIVVLEANPNPDIAYGEEVAEAAEKTGMDYEALMQHIVQMARRRFYKSR